MPRMVGEAAPLPPRILHRGMHPPDLLLDGAEVVDGVGGDHKWLSLRRLRGLVEEVVVVAVVVPTLGLNLPPRLLLSKLAAAPQLP